MRQLVYFEMKKIFTGKLTFICAALVLLLAISSFSSQSLSSIGSEHALAAKYKGLLDDEKVQQMLSDFMPSQADLDKWKGLSVINIGLNSMQSAVHSFFANDDGTWNGKTVADVFGSRQIRVGYHLSWFELSQTITRLNLALCCMIIVIISPVFSSEYGGMDNLILTSRYGKSKCAVAKILSAFLTAVLITAFYLLLLLLAAFIFYGTEGLDSSILFSGGYLSTYIPFNISCGTMLAYQIALTFSGIITLTGISLLISAAGRTQIASLITSALFFLAPLLLSATEQNPLFKVVGLLPVYQIQFSLLMSIEQIKGNLLYAVWAFPTAAITAASGSLISLRFFAKHQVTA